MTPPGALLSEVEHHVSGSQLLESRFDSIIQILLADTAWVDSLLAVAQKLVEGISTELVCM